MDVDQGRDWRSQPATSRAVPPQTYGRRTTTIEVVPEEPSAEHDYGRPTTIEVVTQAPSLEHEYGRPSISTEVTPPLEPTPDEEIPLTDAWTYDSMDGVIETDMVIEDGTWIETAVDAMTPVPEIIQLMDETRGAPRKITHFEELLKKNRRLPKSALEKKFFYKNKEREERKVIRDAIRYSEQLIEVKEGLIGKHLSDIGALKKAVKELEEKLERK
jgi:hypothetical protein